MATVGPAVFTAATVVPGAAVVVVGDVDAAGFELLEHAASRNAARAIVAIRRHRIDAQELLSQVEGDCKRKGATLREGLAAGTRSRRRDDAGRDHAVLVDEQAGADAMEAVGDHQDVPFDVAHQQDGRQLLARVDLLEVGGDVEVLATQRLQIRPRKMSFAL